MSQETIQKYYKAQEAYCNKHKLPFFVSDCQESRRGFCPHCGRLMVNEKWKSEHITGCSRCHISFCE